MVAKVSILTCVTNRTSSGGGWLEGPGHTAIAVGDIVYTFEDLAGFSGDSWLLIRTDQYLGANGNRPVIVQELSSKVSIRKLLGYVQKSIQNDDDYIGSGVCSTQVSAAIKAGLGEDFDPIGIDDPEGVLKLARKRGIVSREYYYWPDRDKLNEADRIYMDRKMHSKYKDVPAAPADGILASIPPGPPPQQPPAPPAQPNTDEIIAVIPRSTTLSGVSMQKYKTYELWSLIWDLNKAAIGENPNRLQHVKELKVRSLSAYSQAEIADARKRAPTWKNFPL